MVRSPISPAMLAVVTVSACAAFQDQDIVVDIRVIAMEANLPEQLVDIPSFVDPPPLSTVLAQIQPAQVCALVADPTHMRALRWSMTLCDYNEDERCDDNGDPQELIGSGLEPSPDYTVPEPSMCATVQPDATFVAVIENALANDPLNGLQGVDYSVVLRVGGSRRRSQPRPLRREDARRRRQGSAEPNAEHQPVPHRRDGRDRRPRQRGYVGAGGAAVRPLRRSDDAVRDAGRREGADHAGRAAGRAPGLHAAHARRLGRDLRREPDLPVDGDGRRLRQRHDRRTATSPARCRRCSPTE